ncbi:MAG: permease-like cell division protein FtsX [bacterium]
MFNSLEFFIAEAWTGFRRSGIMSLVAIGTTTVSLVIFGAFLMAILNLNSLMGSIHSKMEIVAYVNENLNAFKIDALKMEMERLPEVSQVTYKSKADAWLEMKSQYKEKLDLAVVKYNPLPNAFIVRVKSPQMMDSVAKQISNITIVDEVRYSGRIAEKVEALSLAVRIGGLVLVLLLGFATLLIVVNTIRLTVLARQADIGIMKLVGATDSFIKWPFIIEGVLIGVIGAAFSFIILKFSYDTIVFRITGALPFLSLVTDQGQLAVIYLIVAAVGSCLGMLGAYISVNRSLKELV